MHCYLSKLLEKASHFSQVEYREVAWIWKEKQMRRKAEQLFNHWTAGKQQNDCVS